MSNKQSWPDLNFADVQETLETLHHWIQIVGKDDLLLFQLLKIEI